jgi:hypothetical protein
MDLLSSAKGILRRALPAVVRRRQAKWMRDHCRDAFFDRQLANGIKLFGSDTPHVLLGPFAGLKYLNETVWGPIEPKWIGYYEAELHPIFETLPSGAYDAIVDVGSAEGYYSVSLAKKFPSAQIISYDTDPWAREQQARLSALNECKNISIRRNCTPLRLERDIRRSRKPLVICDIEGFEYRLLDPTKAPSLRRADILIEVHINPDDKELSIDEGCQEFIRRFSTSHSPRIFRIEQRNLDLIEANLPLNSMSRAEIAEAIYEHRNSSQKWLWLTTS